MHLGNIVSSCTAMTLDARFTQLRRGDGLYQDGAVASACSGPGGGGGGRMSRLEAVAAASVRNRRLAIQMSRRPTVVAALNRGVSRTVSNGIMHRLGRGALGTTEELGTFRSSAAFAANNNYRRRSNSASRMRNVGTMGGLIGGGSGGVFRRGGINRRGVGRGAANRLSRPRGRSNSVGRMSRSGSLNRLSRAGSVGNLSRSGSLNRLPRSQSLQSLSGWANNAVRGRGIGRGRRRSRGRGGGVLQGFVSRRRDNFPRRGRGTGQGSFRGRRGRSNSRSRNITGTINRDGSLRNFRGGRSNNAFRFRGNRGARVFRGGRGRGRGGGGGGGGRGRQKTQVPTREALDMEIDEYMSTTKSHLDKEIENYMNQPAEETAVANQTNGTVTETWD